MRSPALPPALAILAGLALAQSVAAPRSSLPVIVLLLLYGAALLAFLRCPRAFLALALADAACAAWMLASDAERHARDPSLLAWRATVRNADERVTILEGRLRQDASPGPSGVSLSLDVVRVTMGDRRVEVEGGVVATVGGALAPARADRWRAGRTVRAPVALREAAIFRNAGVRDERVALAHRGIHLFASIKSAALVEVVRPAGWWSERTADARAYARRAVAHAVGRWSGQSGAIVIAILIGDRAGLDDEVVRQLQDAGTYHVIAISGGNIAILAAFLLGAFRLARVRPRVAASVTIAVLAGYADLVGAGASVTRATLMAIACMGALALDHRGSPVNTLYCAGCAILCASPLSVHDPAFALTFGATLGILVGSARVSARLPHPVWVRAPLALFLASAFAELALLPVGAWAFSRVTFAGLLLNFLAIPLMAVAQIAGMFVVPLAAVSASLAAVAGFVAHLGAAGLVWSGSLVEFMPALTWRVPAPGALLVALYYAGWLAWLAAHATRVQPPTGRPPWLRMRRAGSWTGLTCVVLGAAWILVSPLGRIRGSEPTGRLRMTVIDVGQADAILLRFPDARTLLVDTGGSRAGGRFDVGGRVLMPVLWRHDVFRLDVLAITHGDPDHLGGAVALLRDVPIDEMWEGVDVPRDEAMHRVHAQAAARGVASRPVRAGDVFRWDPTQIVVWHPPPPDWERRKVRNDDSLVLEVRFGNVSLLLAGDIGRDVEGPLARHLRPARLCVLKVPHHGSSGSSTPPFIAAAHPSVAIFTIGAAAGAARPALDAVIDSYRHAGATILRTDVDGAVEIDTDGREVRVETAGGRRFVVR